jgi:hypothetical protein
MDEGGHRRRAFHRVGQPDEQRQLSALAARSDEQHQHDHRGNRSGDGLRLGRVVDALVTQRADELEGHEHRDHEPEVADTVGDERLLAGGGRGIAGVPETDQQVRARADAFPAEERDEQVLAEDEHQHAEDEQVQVQEELAELRVTVHVPDRVHVDQRADARDEQRHRDRERIDEERQIDLQAADRQPGEQALDVVAFLGGLRHEIEEHADGHSERGGGHQRGEVTGLRLAEATAEQQDDQEPGQRQGRDEPDDIEHGGVSPSTRRDRRPSRSAVCAGSRR